MKVKVIINHIIESYIEVDIPFLPRKGEWFYLNKECMNELGKELLKPTKASDNKIIFEDLCIHDFYIVGQIVYVQKQRDKFDIFISLREGE